MLVNTTILVETQAEKYAPMEDLEVRTEFSEEESEEDTIVDDFTYFIIDSISDIFSIS